MGSPAVDGLYRDTKAVVEYLGSQGELSFSTATSASLRKVLLLSAASYFEQRLQQIIIDFAGERTSSDSALLSLIQKKAIARQYHTYFDWDSNNANSFFSLFGSEFREHMMQHVTADTSLGIAIRSFLELGRLRNALVHLDFAVYNLDHTFDEIYALYQQADVFVECLPQRLRDDY
jgi:hypothetical protein